MVFALALTGTVWFIWWMKRTWSAEQATVRVLGPTTRMARSSVTAIRIEDRQANLGRGVALPFTRVVVEGTDPGGRFARVSVDEGMSRYTEAVDVIAQWAHQAPGAVDDASRADLEAWAAGPRG